MGEEARSQVSAASLLGRLSNGGKRMRVRRIMATTTLVAMGTIAAAVPSQAQLARTGSGEKPADAAGPAFD